MGVYQVAPRSSAELSKRMVHLSRILDHFWTRWKEYPMELREAHSRKQSGSEVAVGNFVLGNDPDHPQTFWKLARVVELIRSVDGEVRGARTLVGSTGFTLQHPTQAMYPLVTHGPPPKPRVQSKGEEDSNKCTCPS